MPRLVKTEKELELDAFKVELRDYKAAVKYMHFIYVEQSKRYHKFLRKVRKDIRHRNTWEECVGLPCAIERRDLAKIEAVMKQYKQPGDPRGSPDGAP